MTSRSIDGTLARRAVMRATVEEMFKLAPALDEDTADSISEALPYTLAIALTALGRDRTWGGRACSYFIKANPPVCAAAPS